MTVYLVGAGPGDPGLLTRRAVELLQMADVVVHDRLVDPEVLALARRDAEIIDVGKRSGQQSGPRQEHINELLATYGAAGKVVVRLKGGDPFVLGRGGEEAEALDKAGVPWEVVPGVSSAFGVPAAARVPVTHRGISTSVTVVTGHVGDPAALGGVDWHALAKAGGTLVVLMGMATRDAIARRLIDGGRSADTAVAVVQWGTTPAQRVVRTTLSELGAVRLGSPAIIVIGDVAGLELGPGRERPLDGMTVVVTRPAHRAGPTRAALEVAGAGVVEVPVTAIGDPDDGGIALREVATRLSEYRWIAFTSANAVHRLLEVVEDLRSLRDALLAVVGDATARALAGFRLRADLVATRATAEGLVDDFPEPAAGGEPGGTGGGGDAPAAGGAAASRVLFPRAAGARPTLAAGLRAKGWTVEEVEAYRTVTAGPPPSEVRERLADADVVTFAAPSAVDAYLALRDGCGRPLPVPRTVACIGPVTTEAARRRGLGVQVTAAGPSPHSLVEALVAYRIASQVR